MNSKEENSSSIFFVFLPRIRPLYSHQRSVAAESKFTQCRVHNSQKGLHKPAASFKNGKNTESKSYTYIYSLGFSFRGKAVGAVNPVI